ncbi:hypothetical protein DXT76_09540 [Halobacillus trueperi]|uniref:Uncharacterized protein n=1 Tax=Halobacillus trueperi TaxID=156205 RepID=A0A3D8VPE9_9BACI|nr:hypothetical protein [Halobacillus trueperi]RDY71195.1 hypothetical protein DXT76_09540 [Halobacillus trueperi]
MVVLIYMAISIGIAFFLGIIPEGFGNKLLLGAVLGILLGIFHQLTKIYKLLKGEEENNKPVVNSSKIPLRR